MMKKELQALCLFMMPFLLASCKKEVNIKIWWDIIEISLILVIIVYIIYSKLSGWKRRKSNRNDILRRLEKLENRIQELESNYWGQSRSTKREISQDKIKAIEKEIKEIKGELKQLSDRLSSSNDSANLLQAESQDSSKAKAKVGYFKRNNGNCFMQMFEREEEGCLYKATFSSEDSGTFTLLNLEKVKNSNAYDDAIKCNGNVTMQEAKGFDLISPGKWKREGDNSWKIIERIEIEIK